MNKNESKNHQMKIRFLMGDVIDYIVRNYEELTKVMKRHAEETIPYSFSDAFLKAIIDGRAEEETSYNDFFHVLMKEVAQTDSRLLLSLKVEHPDYPHINILPVEVVSNKSNMPLITIENIMNYQQTEEVISLNIKLDEKDGKLEDIYEYARFIVHLNPEYVDYLLQKDKKDIEKEVKRYEKALQKELKETGRLSSRKTKLKFG